MKDGIDIEKLSKLARINVSVEEAHDIKEDIESILEYVGQVQKVTEGKEKAPEVGGVYNVMREDGDSHESGVYTDDLMREAPKTKKKGEGMYVEVKNIL